MRVANTEQIEINIIDSVIKQSGYICLPTVYTEYEEPLTASKVDNTSVNGWISLIKKNLFANPSVDDIFVSIEGSEVDVWVVIAKRDLSVLSQLVEKEEQVIEILVSGENPALLIDYTNQLILANMNGSPI